MGREISKLYSESHVQIMLMNINEVDDKNKISLIVPKGIQSSRVRYIRVKIKSVHSSVG